MTFHHFSQRIDWVRSSTWIFIEDFQRDENLYNSAILRLQNVYCLDHSFIDNCGIEHETRLNGWIISKRITFGKRRKKENQQTSNQVQNSLEFNCIFEHLIDVEFILEIDRYQSISTNICWSILQLHISGEALQSLLINEWLLKRNQLQTNCFVETNYLPYVFYFYFGSIFAMILYFQVLRW